MYNMLKILQCVRTIRAIFKGTAIVIEDRGSKCRTFVGSEISGHRLNVLMLNQIAAPKT